MTDTDLFILLWLALLAFVFGLGLWLADRHGQRQYQQGYEAGHTDGVVEVRVAHISAARPRPFDDRRPAPDLRELEAVLDVDVRHATTSRPALVRTGRPAVHDVQSILDHDIGSRWPDTSIERHLRVERQRAFGIFPPLSSAEVLSFEAHVRDRKQLGE